MVLATAGATVGVAVFCVCVGNPVIWPDQAIRSLAQPDHIDFLRVWELRAPRVLSGAVCGVAFAVAGFLLQRALRNPLAVPELLGVSAGASCAVATVVVSGVALPSVWMPPLAIVGAGVGAAATLWFARGGVAPSEVILIGAAVSAAFSSTTVMVASAADHLQLQSLLRYLGGSLIDVRWSDAAVVVPWVAVVSLIALIAAPVATILSLGDDAADGIGLRPTSARLRVIATAAALVAIPTAYVGPIAWVGFAAPLIAVALRRHDGVGLDIVTTAGCGAVLVMLADTASRTVFAPLETPLGAWTAFTALVIAAAVLARTFVTPRSRHKIRRASLRGRE